jgi:two-component sensor histidine kinase
MTEKRFIGRLAGENAFVEHFELLLRETTHRCANDLQLVASLLSLQANRTVNEEARTALKDAANRVAVLAEARAAAREQQPSLEASLRLVCEALNSQAEPQSVLVALQFANEPDRLSEEQIGSLALCVNELATNALKHAFTGRDRGSVTISVHCEDDEKLVIAVSDDGVPLQPVDDSSGRGLGLELVGRLLRSIGCSLQMPNDGSKRFEITVPLEKE